MDIITPTTKYWLVKAILDHNQIENMWWLEKTGKFHQFQIGLCLTLQKMIINYRLDLTPHPIYLVMPVEFYL